MNDIAKLQRGEWRKAFWRSNDMSASKPARQRMLTPRMAVEHNLKGLPKLIGTIRQRLREWPEYHPGIDGALFRAEVEADVAVKLLKQ